MRKHNLFILISIWLCIACTSNVSESSKATSFVNIENGQFVKNGKPYYYIGTPLYIIYN